MHVLLNFERANAKVSFRNFVVLQLIPENQGPFKKSPLFVATLHVVGISQYDGVARGLFLCVLFLTTYGKNTVTSLVRSTWRNIFMLNINYYFCNIVLVLC